MRGVKTTGLILIGAGIGIGAMLLNDGALGAQAPSGRLKMNATGVEYVGNYGFRFIKDTKGLTCYIASVKGNDVQALAQAPLDACDP